MFYSYYVELFVPVTEEFCCIQSKRMLLEES